MLNVLCVNFLREFLPFKAGKKDLEKVHKAIMSELPGNLQIKKKMI